MSGSVTSHHPRPSSVNRDWYARRDASTRHLRRVEPHPARQLRDRSFPCSTGSKTGVLRQICLVGYTPMGGVEPGVGRGRVDRTGVHHTRPVSIQVLAGAVDVSRLAVNV